MLSNSTKKRIKERKMHKHSNPSQLLKRVKDQSSQAIQDLTLIAENLEEEHLEQVFTFEKLEPLIIAVLKSETHRTLEINEMLATRVHQKLLGSINPTITSRLGDDMGKTLSFAQLAVDLSRESIQEKK